MAIQFARARFVSRSKGGSAVRSAAYNQRAELTSERTGERHRYHDDSTLAHHEVLLPAGADQRFLSPAVLWNAAEAAERRKDSQVALEVVIALPSDPTVTHSDLVGLTRSFIKTNWIDRGLAAQFDIHNAGGNPHAHILITTRRLDGDHLAPRKAADLMPTIRMIRGHPTVTAAEEWGTVWRDHQNSFFRDRGSAITVDPIAPYPAQHIGPKRFRHPQDPRITAAASLDRLNAGIARNPKATLDHLRSQQQHFDGRALERFLHKNLPDPAERGAVKAKVDELALIEASRLDRVPSGWRKLTVQDVARDLSPEYSKRVAQGQALNKKTIPYATKMRDWNAANIQEADRTLEKRWDQMGVMRRLLHLSHIHRDPDIARWEIFRETAERGVERWSIRRKAATDLLSMVRRQAKAAIDQVRPAAEQELARRQKIAQNARRELSHSEKTTLIHGKRHRQARTL